MGEMHPSNRCADATVHWEELEEEGGWEGGREGGSKQGRHEERRLGGNEWMKSRLNVLYFLLSHEWDQSGGRLSAV